MSLVSVDSQKCIKCGMCAQVCPVPVLCMDQATGFPAVIKQMRRFCIDCGHCVAVCPKAAITRGSLSPDTCPLIDQELIPTPQQIDLFLKSRRSIRKFKQQELCNYQIQEILDVAAYAPSGKNTMPLEWKVINDLSVMKELGSMSIEWAKDLIEKEDPLARAMFLKGVIKEAENGSDPILRGAPTLIMVHADPKHVFAQSSAYISLTYLELAAHSHGLGTCWAGFFQMAAQTWQPIKEKINLSDGREIIGAMLLGKPAYKYIRIPRRPLKVEYIGNV